MSKPLLPDGFDDDVLRTVASLLNLKTQAGMAALRVALENTVLLDNKQLDYGPTNIAKWGTFGCVVRMTDKFERIHTLYNKGKKRRAINESIHDTFRDISNYAIIALLCDSKQWPLDTAILSPTKSQTSTSQ